MLLQSLLSFLLQLVNPTPEPTAEILFAGDAMQHEDQLVAAQQEDKTYSYDECYEYVDSIISAADYAVVNLETPIGSRRYSGYPCFNAPVSYAIALQNSGFDMMLTANNHALDRGSNGLISTINVLDSISIDHIGTYKNLSDRDSLCAKIIDVNGFKIGFLNYTYDTNGIKPSNGVIVNYIDTVQIKRDIIECRELGAEIICVAPHWGDEYKLLPVKSQRTLAQFLINQGVDIIFGGHPHVIQPMKLIENPITGKNTALIYSLGNFISNMNTRDTRGGAIAKLKLKRDSEGIAFVESLAYRLIFTKKPNTNKENFIVIPAEQALELRLPHCDEFLNSATEIFDKNNVNISNWN